MDGANRNWIDEIAERASFFLEAEVRRQKDRGFPWKLAELANLPGSETARLDWLKPNGERLWEARSLFRDGLSGLHFDEVLVMRLAGHGRFFFPRTDFDDFAEAAAEQPFNAPGFPADYLGVPLKAYEMRLKGREDAGTIRLIACEGAVDLLNYWHQYFLCRDGVDMTPNAGEVVFDCGACIGEVSTLFAGLVGPRGEVHAFDPIPLHARFCRLQASMNPALAAVLHVNELAVGACSYTAIGKKKDSDSIAPGGLAIDSFKSTTLDEYAGSNCRRVDYVKMDVEGAEMEALAGAEKLIREFRPRLAISAYHKPDDLWQIPLKLKSLLPDYELYFGHHSPVVWESVVYAICKKK